jgi:dihydrofolate synthase/folylpolyglutamate synthase
LFLADHWLIPVLTYPETLDYLFDLRRFGVKLGLETITNLLQRLDHPQRKYATLHIGGTNGKGSSAAMVAAMLQAGGYRVGLYTSPHLIDFRERIRVQDGDISEAHVCELTARIRHVADPLGSLTFFEFTTAMAFQYFLDQQVDIAVIEVGLGGRYDATNVLDPLGVLVTSIGFDHEMYLGQTLPEIAREKAGIIHHDVPVVLGEMPDSVNQVFKEIAQKYNAPLYRYGEDFSISETSQTDFFYRGFRERFSGLQTNLLGRHQMSNAGCALALLESATAERFPLSVDAIKSGLQHVRWKGRLEIVQHDPMVILDGAHNPLGARVLFDFLQSQLHDCPGRKIIVVLGMMNDKPHAEYVQVLLPLIDTLIVTQPHMNRAATVDELRHAVPREDVKICAIADPWEAYSQAHQDARPSDLICVTGSLFLVGEVLQHLTRPLSPTSKN